MKRFLYSLTLFFCSLPFGFLQEMKWTIGWHWRNCALKYFPFFSMWAWVYRFRWLFLHYRQTHNKIMPSSLQMRELATFAAFLSSIWQNSLRLWDTEVLRYDVLKTFNFFTPHIGFYDYAVLFLSFAPQFYLHYKVLKACNLLFLCRIMQLQSFHLAILYVNTSLQPTA